MTGAPDVGADQGGVEVRGELTEDLGVVVHEPEEGGAPGGERDRIDQRQRTVDMPREQVGSQGDGPPDVVGDDVRRLDPRVLQQRLEQLALRRDGDVVSRRLLGAAVPEHVPAVDTPRRGQPAGQALPQGRGPGGPMAEHQWLTLTLDAPVHPGARCAKPRPRGGDGVTSLLRFAVLRE